MSVGLPTLKNRSNDDYVESYYANTTTQTPPSWLDVIINRSGYAACVSVLSGTRANPMTLNPHPPTPCGVFNP